MQLHINSVRFYFLVQGLGGSMSQVVGLPNNSYKPITNTAWVWPGFVNCKKGRTRLAAASDKVYQLLAQGRWFSPGTLASSTSKTGGHDIAEILLKVVLNTKNQINQSYKQFKILFPCTIIIHHFRMFSDGRFSWRTFSFRRIIMLGTVVVSVFCLSFGPFIFMVRFVNDKNCLICAESLNA